MFDSIDICGAVSELVARQTAVEMNAARSNHYVKGAH